MKKYVDKDKLQEFTTKLANRLDDKYMPMFSSPLKASTVSDMTDEEKVYVYVGSETGYTNGNWYYYDGSAWVSGGVYNSTAFVTDKTLSYSGQAADAKASGDAIKDIKEDLDEAVLPIFTPLEEGYLLTNGNVNPPDAYGEATTAFIPVLPGTKIRFQGEWGVSTSSNWCAYCLYKANKSLVTAVGRVAFVNSVVAPTVDYTIEITNTDAAYIRICWRKLHVTPKIRITQENMYESNIALNNNIKLMPQLRTIASGGDLNNCTEAGLYSLTSGSYTNCPVSGAKFLEVFSDNAGYLIQRLTMRDTGTCYYRYRSAGTWQSWVIVEPFKNLQALTAGTNLDNLTLSGYYTLSYSGSYTNAPVAVGRRVLINLVSDSTSFINQLFLRTDTGEVWYRTKAGSPATWGDWVKREILFNESQTSKSYDTDIDTNTSTSSVNGDRVRIMSYNVAHYNNDTSTYLDSVYDHLVAFKKLLMFSKADVLTIPEDDEYIDSGDSKDSTTWLYKPIYPIKVGGGGACIHSKTTLQNTETITLNSGNVIRKGVLPVGNKQLYIYSVHLPVSSASDRATDLAEIFAKINSDNPTYYVIAGDMNCIESGENETFKQTCEENGCTLANGGFLGWLSTHKNNLPLDNIVVSDKIIIENTEVLGNWFDSLYSDHYPIFSDLVLLD